MDNKFEIVGLDELIAAFEKFGDLALETLEPYIDRAGDVLLNSIKQEVPVLSGRLKNSLYLKKPKTMKNTIMRIVTWHSDVSKYAAPVELGHHLVFFGKKTNKSIPAHPFMRPGADKAKDQVFDVIIKGMGEALEKMGGLK